jgi:hypothetical protein
MVGGPWFRAVVRDICQGPPGFKETPFRKAQPASHPPRRAAGQKFCGSGDGLGVGLTRTNQRPWFPGQPISITPP